MFSIFAYAILSLLMDRTGPVFLSIVGGLFETFGLILLAYVDITNTNENNDNDMFSQLPFDVLDFAVSIVGIGSSAIMVHALKLAFLVPTAKFAWVMTLTNCIVDGSAVRSLQKFTHWVAEKEVWIWNVWNILKWPNS